MRTTLERKLADALRFTMRVGGLYNGFAEPGRKAIEAYDRAVQADEHAASISNELDGG